MTDEELERLLPWYANGTLEPELRPALEAWLERNPRGRAELEELRAIGDAIRAEARPGPGELGLERLRRMIREDRKPATEPERAHGSANMVPRGWRFAAVAASVLLVSQSVWIGLERQSQDPALAPQGMSQPDSAPQEGMRGPAATSAGVDRRAGIEVRFAPSATIGEIAALLDEIGASIVAGPDENDRYRLQLEAASLDREAVRTALGRLRTAGGIVLFAGEAP